jgi:deoxyribodipyrimidine photo-lyase
MTVTSLFLFHRDLRLADNTALLQAFTESDRVILAFIFPPEQIDPVRNPYFSHPAVQFMCESLIELRSEFHGKIGVHVFKGDNVATLEQIKRHVSFQSMYQNEDYSVYAQKRDAEIRKWCGRNSVEYKSAEDYGLFPFKEGLVEDADGQRPYTVLAQFYNRYLKDLDVRKTAKFKQDWKDRIIGDRIPNELSDSDIRQLYRENPDIAERAGRREGLQIIGRLKKFNDYKDTRDFPALEDGTTRVSAHLKFGTISVREFYWACVRAFGTRDHPLIRELIFREFYMKIYASRPELQRGTAFHNDLDKHIPWRYVKKDMEAWRQGRTGFPLVDAGMRQLNTINWCHNRVRMLVASVATKYLLLDWRECARWFYTKLVDADTFSNTAGWGWASSTGVDATLYFRAPFNPFIQSKKFDKDCSYIKRYVPELRDVPATDIHKWYDPKVRAKYPSIAYPAPIVDYKEASARAIRVFKEAVKQGHSKT